MGQVAEVFAFVCGLAVAGDVTFARVFGDGARDGIVKASVQCAKSSVGC